MTSTDFVNLRNDNNKQSLFTELQTASSNGPSSQYTGNGNSVTVSVWVSLNFNDLSAVEECRRAVG